jgi:hypothetical protein
MDVKFEGKNVQLLGDPMTNNGGASGSPPNSATMVGEMQLPVAFQKEIRATMKVVAPICPSGNPLFPEHEWEAAPSLPKGSTRKAVESLQKSGDPSAKFEGDAAAANIAAGDLSVNARDRASKVSRDVTAAERRAGVNGNRHKVFRNCTRAGCGTKAEIDHVVGESGQAEVKNVNRFDSFEQMKRNRSIQKQTGATIMYKINGNNPNAATVKATIEYAARVAGLRTVVRVI